MKTFEKVRMTRHPKINSRPASKSKSADLLRDNLDGFFSTPKKSKS